jgi:predicted nucleic acid-binding protein
MEAIVADTTPLNYLLLIQAGDILPNLYRRVLIPPAVKAELAHANTPAIVRAWISQPPPWLEVVSLKQPPDSALVHLDAGEREAISLASELQAILLLMDERRRDYSSASWIEGGRHARSVGPCCSPWTR